MTLDVTWDGVALAKGAQAREQDGGWFVEMEQPMPVGTVLQLTGDTQATVRVARVHEGVGAGMLMKKVGGAQATAADRAEPQAEVEKAEKAEAVEKVAGEENGKRERRKKGPRRG